MSLQRVCSDHVFAVGTYGSRDGPVRVIKAGFVCEKVKPLLGTDMDGDSGMDSVVPQKSGCDRRMCTMIVRTD